MTHQSPDDLDLGAPLSLRSKSIPSTPMSWHKMWDIIFNGVEQRCSDRQAAHSESTGKPASHDETSEKKSGGFLDPCSKKVDREALAHSKNIIELNRVTHPSYTKTDQQAAIAADEACGAKYIQENIHTEGALFLIRLKHYEGELPVGLGRRTFNKDMDVQVNDMYEIEWYERKNKKQHSWGLQPGFKPAIAAYNKHRKGVVMKSVESLKDFIPITVKATPTSTASNPVLSQNTMHALREKMSTIASATSELECDVQEEEGVEHNGRGESSDEVSFSESEWSSSSMSIASEKPHKPLSKRKRK